MTQVVVDAKVLIDASRPQLVVIAARNYIFLGREGPSGPKGQSVVNVLQFSFSGFLQTGEPPEVCEAVIDGTFDPPNCKFKVKVAPQDDTTFLLYKNFVHVGTALCLAGHASGTWSFLDPTYNENDYFELYSPVTPDPLMYGPSFVLRSLDPTP